MEVPLRGLLILALVASYTTAEYDGLYMSNGTNILFSKHATQGPTSVYGQENARIVGIDTDIRDKYIFWSDIGFTTRGIYRANMAEDGTLSDVKKLIYQDIGEINGLSVDYINKHLYWTDNRKRTIEISDYEGNNRRVLINTGLYMPRGIVADVKNKYLFWNDQGDSMAKIERSYLDGSERKTIVSSDHVTWPNQMVVDIDLQKLLWVDGKSRKVKSCTLDGGDVQDIIDLSTRANNNVLFGLALYSNVLYVSAWETGKVFSISKSGDNLEDKLTGLGNDALFSLAYVNINLDKDVSSPCASNNGGCSHLCLQTAGDKRCSCPSYGGLTLSSNQRSCTQPDKLLFYCLGEQGIVGYKNMDSTNDLDTYIVGKSLRPVAVTYDPVEQKVYWSDAHERAIHVAKLDGSDHELFLTSNDTIGVVDGLAVDVNARNLYFTNMGMVEVDGASFGWHKAEVIGLDGTGRRTIYDEAERPRDIFIEGSKVYITDWGSQASVIKVNKDGSNPEHVLYPGLDNPNGVYVRNNEVFILDSHYKTQKPENDGSFGQKKDAALYVVPTSGSVQKPNVQLDTPFGITYYNNKFYVSDWGRNAIIKLNADGDEDSVFISGVEAPMGLHYSNRQMNAGSSTCSSKQCSADGVCLDQAGQGTCFCDSYDAKVLQSGSTCAVPSSYMILADFNSLKIRSLSGSDTSINNVFGGSSYFSNMVSVALDDQNDVIYFSDVNRRNIYKTSLATGETHLFLEMEDDIIDGMTFSDGKLYWTDFYAGELAFADTTASTPERKSLQSNLDKPRAVVVRNNKIYWTEWGEKKRVRRADLPQGGSLTDLKSDGLSRPNGLDIVGDKMYIGDAPRDGQANVLECDLNGNNCQELAYMTGVPAHIYSIRVYGRGLYYSDWEAGEVAMIDMQTGVKQTLAKDLMRPTEIIVKYDGQLPTACGQNDCVDSCVAYHGGQYCVCNEGRVLQDDGRTCADSKDLYMPAPDSSCSSSCGSNQVCSKKIGSIEVECVCKPGYGGSSCTECAAGSYKMFAGNYECETCTSGSTSNADKTMCQCTNALSWNRDKNTCVGAKPGNCPSVSLPELFSCDVQSCGSDSACPGAQKCCGSAHCGAGEKRCRDPVGLRECVYMGVTYRLDRMFTPDACTTCTCTPDKFYDNPLYGGAMCTVMDCPPLNCEEGEGEIRDAGSCCPYCGEVGGDPLQFTNCPDGTLQLDLPDDADSTKLQRQWNFKVRGGLEVKHEKDPVDDYYFYQGDTVQQVKVTARAGSYTAQCDFGVLVKDVTAPEVTYCPRDIEIETKIAPVKVKWTPPQYEDNVCGPKSPLGVCKVKETSLKFGQDFNEGDHSIKYEIEDLAGQKAECSFNVKVSVTDKCASPIFYFGSLDCEAGRSKQCKLKCDVGYSISQAAYSEFSCSDDVWQPEINERLKRIQCRRELASEINSAISITGLKCPSRSDVRSALRSVEERVTNRIGNNSPINVNVNGRGCGQPTLRAKRETMEIDINLQAQYTNDAEKSEREEAISSAITSIKQAIENGDLVLYDEADPSDAQLTTSPVVSGCPPGSEPGDNSNACFACSVGEYEKDGKCEECPVGEYQDQQGQTSCTRCPEGESTDQQGSVYPSDCNGITETLTTTRTPAGSGPDMLPIIIGVCVGGAVLIIIIIVIIVVCIRRKKQDPGNPNAADSSFPNKAYQPDSSVYAEIDEKKVGSNGAPDGDYTSAHFVGKDADPYTKLG